MLVVYSLVTIRKQEIMSVVGCLCRTLTPEGVSMKLSLYVFVRKLWNWQPWLFPPLHKAVKEGGDYH